MNLQPFQQVSSSDHIRAHFTPAMMEQIFREFWSGFAPRSRVTLRSGLSHLADVLGMQGERVEHLPWHTLTAANLSEALLQWQGHLEPSTMRLYMHAARGISRACFVRGVMPADQYALIKEVKLPRGRNKVGRGRAVALEYRNKLLHDCATDERVQGVRDAAIVAMLFGSGMRRAEVASVCDEHIDLDEGELTVMVKGGHKTVKYLAAWALPYLEHWRQVRRSQKLVKGPFFGRVSKGGKLFADGFKGGGRSIYYLLEERSLRAGLPFLVKPHDARRTFASWAIAEHGELAAQRLLGHADLSTTRLYDKRDEGFLKDIMRATK